MNLNWFELFKFSWNLPVSITRFIQGLNQITVRLISMLQIIKVKSLIGDLEPIGEVSTIDGVSGSIESVCCKLLEKILILSQ